MNKLLQKYFGFDPATTTIRTEIIAGVSTFLTMAYILAVNPAILGITGMDKGALFATTAITSGIATLIMALYAKMPFGLAPGMGINAFFAYTVCLSMGHTWQFALTAVLLEGLIFILLTVTNVREKIVYSLPPSIQKAIGVGIGLFIAFIGLQNAKLVIGNKSTLVSITNFTKDFHTAGICSLLAVVGLLITVILYIKKVPGSILIGILATWVIGMLCQVTGIYVPDFKTGYYSLFPTFAMTDFSKLGETFGKCFQYDLGKVGIFNFIAVVLSFLFVDLFDTLGTLVGVSTKAGMLDEEGKLPGIKSALMADAVATTAGAILGTSTVTTFVESSSGVAAGGRTGLTAVVSGFLFLISTLFAPLFTAIPSFATAPALIMVGFLMFGAISDIKFTDDNMTEAVPAYLCIIAMPLFYSISEGISIGIISYVILNVVCGKAKKITPLMYVLAVLFILKYAVL